MTSAPEPGQPAMPPDVTHALQRGDKIEAIKLLRQATGLGLKEAKDAVERMAAGESPDLPQPATPAALSQEIASALQRGEKIEAIRLYRQQTGVGLKDAKEAIEAASEGRGLAGAPSAAADLAPGEVKRLGGLGWAVLAALVAAAIAAYLFLKAA